MRATLAGWKDRMLKPIGRQVVVDVGSTLTGNAYAALSAFGAGVLLAGWLGPEQRGVFELGLFVANGTLLLLGLGLNVPVTVFVVKEPHLAWWGYRLGIQLCLFYATFGLAALFGLSRLGWPWSSVSVSLSLSVLLVFISLLLMQLVNALLVGLGRIHGQNLAVAARATAFLATVLGLSLIVRPSVELALAGFGASALVGCLVGWYGLRDIARSKHGVSLNQQSRLNTLWFGIRAQFGNIFQFASYRLDVLLVSLWVGEAGLGVYAVGVMFTEVLWLLPNAVGIILLSHTSRFSRGEAERRIGSVFTLTMGMVVLGAALLTALVPLTVHFYLKSGYALVPLVTWLLMPGAVALSGTKVLANELTARGFPGINTVVAIAGAVVTISGDVLLIPRMGIVGAALASTVGYAVSLALTWKAFRNRSEAPLLTWPVREHP